MEQYTEERGYPPYHPTMMTALLLYAFQQVLKLCQRADLVKLGHVALDGTKVTANASKHKAMSYEHMKKKEQELAATVAAWFAKAAAVAEAEDRAYGPDRRGDEMPGWVSDKTKRLEKVRAAKAELEAEAKQQLKAESEAKAEAKDDDGPPKPPRGGKKRPKENGEPHDKAQLNFTDRDSRIMKGPTGFVQANNCQATVDTTAQIIVAHSVNNIQNDASELIPLVAQVENRLGRDPVEVSADSGYLSEANLEELDRRRICGYIATGRVAHDGHQKRRRKLVGPGTLAMRGKLDEQGRSSPYRLQKHTVEPVFGQIKGDRRFRRFHLRGPRKVPHE